MTYVNLTISPKVVEHVEIVKDADTVDLGWLDTVEVVLNTTQAAMLMSELSTLLADAMLEEYAESSS